MSYALHSRAVTQWERTKRLIILKSVAPRGARGGRKRAEWVTSARLALVLTSRVRELCTSLGTAPGFTRSCRGFGIRIAGLGMIRGETAFHLMSLYGQLRRARNPDVRD